MDEQTKAIIHLQERTSKSTREDASTEPVVISVKPPKIHTPTPAPPIPAPPIFTPITSAALVAPTENWLKSDTKVYTIWFDDDALGYEVNEIFLLERNTY